MESINLVLVRDKPGPWGFRLQGGLDFEKALTVAFVNEGSFSYNSGLKTGDVIANIGHLESALLTHKEAQDAIIQQGNSVHLTVQRKSAETGPDPGTWRPQVQIVGAPAISAAGPDQVYTRTSLALNPKPQEEHWDVKHNITAKGFQGGGGGATTLRSVAAPVSYTATREGGPPAPSGGPPAPSGFRPVSAPAPRPQGPVQPPPGPPQQQVCWACSKQISGVFLQVKGRPLHGDCFNCTTCRASLKNVGHFVIGDKLYCQLHAREVQNAIHGVSVEQSPPVGPPQGRGPPLGLAQNLAKLSLKAQPASNGLQCPPAPPPTAAVSPLPPADWANRLNSNSAALAGNAEDFTKEFMKQLIEGSGV